MNFTVVLGIDARHIERVPIVYPSWYDNKKEIRESSFLIFYDETQLCRQDILNLGLRNNVEIVPWSRSPEANLEGEGKFFNPQRQLMLAGFIFIPPAFVKTDYWMKLDLDVVATDKKEWLFQRWFDVKPAIIGHSWGYTKPANQLDILDDWSDAIPEFSIPKLKIPRDLKKDKVVFPRISSWCSLYSTQFSEFSKKLAERSCGEKRMPVPSQDGFHWYTAFRLSLPIWRINFKAYGWDVKNSMSSIKEMAENAKNPKE